MRCCRGRGSDGTPGLRERYDDASESREWCGKQDKLRSGEWRSVAVLLGC
jgi:hypothetical protein